VTGVKFAGDNDPPFGWHMAVLFARAKREGKTITRECW
jgi:hypothetical protein